MAKFVYRMQNILAIKEKLESQAEAAYSLANRRYLEERDKLSELLVRRSRYDANLKRLMEGSLDIRSIRNAKNDVTMIKALIRAQTMQLKRAEMEMIEARNELQNVMKERKTHEKLKEHEFEAFKKEIASSEAKEVDELVSFNYNKQDNHTV